MQPKVLNHENSSLNNYLAEIRDIHIQNDREKFRMNLEKCGFILAYEISKHLNFSKKLISTPLKECNQLVLEEDVVLACILRASLPFYNGFLKAFPKAESGFVGAARKHSDAENFEIEADYYALPSIENKTLLLIDPMLATGKSMLEVINHLCKDQKPSRLILSSLIATPDACSYLKKNLDFPFEIFTVALDPELTSNYYISPGLGDAGDLAFGPKV